MRSGQKSRVSKALLNGLISGFGKDERLPETSIYGRKVLAPMMTKVGKSFKKDLSITPI
jgi:hypothetical protein